MTNPTSTVIHRKGRLERETVAPGIAPAAEIAVVAAAVVVPAVVADVVADVDLVEVEAGADTAAAGTKNQE